jgi:RNA polymerase sigma-70 factor, ECF subfamily
MELLNYWSSKTNADHMETPTLPMSGQPATAEDVFLSHTPRVYNLARRMLGNDADAEDVTQDVFLQVVRKLDSFRGEAELTTWLHKVVVNAVLLHRRRQASRNFYQAGDQLELFLHDPSNPSDRRPVSEAPDQRLLDEELRGLLEDGIGRLPDVYRDVYVLADVEGCANAEIGEVLGLSLAAVKSRLHRARLLMRKILAPHFEEASA